MKTDWDNLRKQADNYLSKYATVVEQFGALVTPLFEQMWERTTKPIQRRPNISLRLIAEGEPKAKLITLPLLRVYYGQKTLDCGVLFGELMVEWTQTIGGVEAKKWTKQLTYSLHDEPAVSLIRPSVLDDLRRVVETMRQFVADPRVVLARCHDNFAICGRSLVDEVSRARGIGPECIRLADCGVWWQAINPSRAADLFALEGADA